MTQTSWTATSSTTRSGRDAAGRRPSAVRRAVFTKTKVGMMSTSHSHSFRNGPSKPATVSNVAKAPFHQLVFTEASASFKWRGASTVDFFFKLCMLIGCITVSKWYSVKAFGRIHIVLNPMIITLRLNVKMPSRLSLTLTELNVCCLTLWRWRTLIVFLNKVKVVVHQSCTEK